jgi:hypothetical protein
MTSKLYGVMILLDGSTIFIERDDHFKIDFSETAEKKTIFRPEPL